MVHRTAHASPRVGAFPNPSHLTFFISDKKSSAALCAKGNGECSTRVPYKAFQSPGSNHGSRDNSNKRSLRAHETDPSVYSLMAHLKLLNKTFETRFSHFRSDLTKRQETFFVAISLFLLAVMFWGPALRDQQTLLSDVIFRYYLGSFSFIRESLHQGAFPFWNPY